jgi:hypothetical protein
MAKLERSKYIKVDVIQQVLAMVRNIGESYAKAPPELQRLYLGLFWDKFTAENKEITEAVKSPIVQAVEAVGLIIAPETKKPLLAQESLGSPISTLGNKVILRPLGGCSDGHTSNLFGGKILKSY